MPHSHIEKATIAFDKTPHGALDVTPEDLPPSTRTDPGRQPNIKEIDKRKAKLEKLGGSWRTNRRDLDAESTLRQIAETTQTS
jgi:hypothetical protein